MQTQSELLYNWGKGLDPCVPRVEPAHNEFLVTDDGEELIDAAAGAAVVNLGHSIPGMTETLSEQSSEIAYLTLSHFKHDVPMRLARDLAAAAPDGLSTVFFANSGSEANEAAFKLARAYHCARGDTERSVVISRWQSYHGSTLGALSATGNTGRRREFEPYLSDWEHISPAYPYRWPFDGSPEEQLQQSMTLSTNDNT